MKRLLILSAVAIFLLSCNGGKKGKAPDADSLQGAPMPDTTGTAV